MTPAKPPPDARNRSLEGPAEGPLRSRIRDADEERSHRIWLRGLLYRIAIWVTGVAGAVILLREPLTHFLVGLGGP